jgi:hypothetical protein
MVPNNFSISLTNKNMYQFNALSTKCHSLLQYGYKRYSALCRNYSTTMWAIFGCILDIPPACCITHHISILVKCLSVLKFPLSGKLLQIVKLLTCVRQTSSSWTTAFQSKGSKLHTECRSYDKLWPVQYCVYASYCCCSNLYTRITEHDHNQSHWMKDMSTLHQEWSV